MPVQNIGKVKIVIENYKIIFYKYMIKSGFDLERGNTIGNEHIPTATLKKVTNYEMQEMFKETKHQEQEIITNDINIMK